MADAQLSPLTLPTQSGALVDFAAGMVLLEALTFVAERAGANAGTAASRLELLLQALAEDARDAAGTHLGTSGVGSLLGQLKLVKSTIAASLRKEILAFPEVQRLYRRLAEMQGTTPWLFRVDQTTGSFELVTVAETSDHPPLELRWSKESTGSGSAVAPVFVLSADVEAKLSLDTFAVSPTSGDCGIRLTAKGGIAGSLGATAVAPVVATASISGWADAELSLLYQLAGSTRFVEALDLLRTGTPDPTRLSSLASKLTQPQVRGLRRASYRIGAGGKLALDLTLARASASAFSLPGPTGPAAVNSTLGVSARFGFAFGREMERTVEVELETDGALSLRSRVQRTQTQQISAGFELGFDFEGLDTWAVSWFERALPGVPESITKTLKAYANPGTKLTEALEASLGSSKGKLVALLFGALPPEQAQAALEQRILAPLQRAYDSLDNAFDTAADKPTELANRIARILSEQTQGRIAAAQIQALIAAPVGKAWTQVLDGLRDELDAGFAQAKAKLKKELGAALAPLSDVLGGSGAIGNVEQLVGHAQGVLKKYGEFRKRVFGEVQKALSGRLAFAFTYAREDAIESWLSRRYSIVTSGLSDASWREVDETYRRFLRGGLSERLDLAGSAIRLVEEELGASGSTKRVSTATLDLMPFHAFWRADRRAAAEIHATPTGEFRSATGSFENKEAAGRKRLWKVGFAGTLNLMDVELRQGIPGAPMGFEVSAAFAKIAPKDVGDVLRRLTASNAFGATPLFDPEAMRRWEERIGRAAGQGKSHALRISFGLIFPGDLLDEFVAACGSVPGGKRYADALLAARRAAPGDEVDQAIQLALDALSKAAGRSCEEHELFFAVAEPQQHGLPRMSIDVPGKSIRVGNNSIAVKKGLQRLNKVLRAWSNLRVFAREIDKIPGIMRDLSQRLGAATSDGKVELLEAGIAELLAVQSRANAGLGHSLDGSDYAGTGLGIAPDTAALLAFTADTLGESNVQRPMNSLRVFIGPRADSPDEVTWTELD